MTAHELIANSYATAKARGYVLPYRMAANAKGDAVAIARPGEPWEPAAERQADGYFRHPMVYTIDGQPGRMTAAGPITAADEGWQEVAP